MTTIVIKDGIMGTDSRAYVGHGSAPLGSKNKLHRISDGSMIGVSATQAGLAERVVRYYDELCHFDEEEVDVPDTKGVGITVLLMRPNGDVFYACDSLLLSGPLKASYFAIGSGAEYAMGAFAMGASVTRAIEVAIEHDAYSDYPIRTCQIGQDRVTEHNQ